MRALVTGGTGFVGANLVAELTARKIAVRILRRESSSLAALSELRYETVTGNILNDPRSLVEAMSDCDWVFHVAGLADSWRYKKTDLLYKVNVEGTKNMLVAAQKAGVKRFVYTGSLSAMGIPAQGQLLNETSKFNLKPKQYPYGHSKYLAENEVLKAREKGLQTIVVNPSIIIGPRDVNQIGGSLILEAAKGRLRFYPPGGVNFIAVEDVAAGHIAAAEQGKIGERYILGGENLSYKSAFSMICKEVGRRAPTTLIPRWMLPIASVGVIAARILWKNQLPLDANMVHMSAANIYADSRKAIKELGLPQTPFRNAVQRAHAWYIRNEYD